MSRSPSVTVAEATCIIREATACRGAPHKQNIFNRVGGYVCCPVWCGACCLWSTVFRFFACPFQCICNGPPFLCSNNHCTTVTDSCIESYLSNLDERQRIPRLDEIDTTGASQEGLSRLEAVLQSLIAAMPKDELLVVKVASPLLGMNKSLLTSDQAVVRIGLFCDKIRGQH